MDQLLLVGWLILGAASSTSWMIAVTAAAAAATTTTTTEDAQEPGPDFFNACSGGDYATVMQALQRNPSWKDATTDHGESCLHVAGIFGHPDITKLVLSKGGDPNIRSTYELGLRMHPLSWNIYHGHVKNIQLLLEYGANVNLDFDSMGGGGGKKKEPATVLDIANQLLVNEQESPDDDSDMEEIHALLLKHGAKTYAQLQREEGKNGAEL